MPDERPDRCETCRFWEVGYFAGVAEYEHHDHKTLGVCRRYPAEYPKDIADWCGEWKPAAGSARPRLALSELVAAVDAPSILARLDQIEDERKILLPILRSALANERRKKK